MNYRQLTTTFILTLLLLSSHELVSDIVIGEEEQKEIELTAQEKIEQDKSHGNFLHRHILIAEKLDDGIYFVFANGKEKRVNPGEMIHIDQDHHGNSKYALASQSKENYDVQYQSNFSRAGKTITNSGTFTLPYNKSIFIHAAHGNLDSIDKSISSGVHVDSLSSSGMTILMVAAITGQLDVIDFLIGRGANPDERQKENIGDRIVENKSVLYLAKNCPSAFQRLITLGADPWYRKSKYEFALVEDRRIAQDFHMFNTIIGHSSFDVDSQSARKSYVKILDSGPLFALASYIEHGVDVNQRWEREKLSYSMEERQKFKKEGIDINTIDDAETSIQRVARHQLTRRYRQEHEFWMLSQYLVKVGADESQYSKTYSKEEIVDFIKWILKRSPVEDIRVLLENGIIDPNLQLKTGATSGYTDKDGKKITTVHTQPLLDFIKGRHGRHNPVEREHLRSILIAAGATTSEKENKDSCLEQNCSQIETVADNGSSIKQRCALVPSLN